MKPVCEIITQYVLPELRALIARELIETHKLTQKEAARRLGMTQPAVSQYKKHIRGNRVKFLEKDKLINEKISKISSAIAKNEMNSMEATLEICKICKLIRKRGLLCELHKEVYPVIEECDICFD